MKRILFIANYFYPDVASLGQLITDLCLNIKSNFEIEVIAAIPNYSNIVLSKNYQSKRFYTEMIDGIKVHRIIVPNVNKRNKFSRISYILRYYLNARFSIKKIGDFDLVFSTSQPPILGGMLGRYAKTLKKAKFIYNIQDFNPEQIEVVNFTKSKMLIKLLKTIDNTTCKHADKIVLVGSEMLNTLEKRNMSFKEKGVVINNWINDKDIFPLSKTEKRIKKFLNDYDLNNKFIIMYSGNLGLFYDLENLIKVASELKDNKEIVFVFAGDGAKKLELENYKNRNNLCNIIFIPYQSKDDLIFSLNIADVHLVVNAQGIKGISVPSKIYGVLAVGKYVIGVLEEDSEARNIIEKSKVGKCVSPMDYEGFKNLILDGFKNWSSLYKIGLNGRRYLEENLSMEISINKYKNLFNELCMKVHII